MNEIQGVIFIACTSSTYAGSCTRTRRWISTRNSKDEADIERSRNVRNLITERFVTVKTTIYATRLLQETSEDKRDLNRGKNKHVARISPMRDALRHERKSPVIYYGYWRLKLIKKCLDCIPNCINFEPLTFSKESLIFVRDIRNMLIRTCNSVISRAHLHIFMHSTSRE